MQRSHKLLIPLLALMLSLFFTSTASAQEKVSFKLAPTTIEDKIDPGSTHSYTLTVQNTGTLPATLYPIARNITGVTDSYQPIYSTDANDQNYELASWITYQESQLTVGPGESQALHFTVTFPKDAHPGSHMAGIFLADKPSDQIRNGSGIGFEVGSILSFQVAGEIVEDTQIREFYTAKTVYGSPNVGFTIRLENRGNILSRPHGLIDINDMFGKKVDSVSVNENAAGVFPNTTREFTASWKPDGFEFGRFDAVLALSIDGPKGNQTISRVTQFWILPMNILLPVFGTLLFIVLVIYVILRVYVRRQLSGVRTRTVVMNASGLSRLMAVVIGLLVAVIIGLLVLFLYFG